MTINKSIRFPNDLAKMIETKKTEKTFSKFIINSAKMRLEYERGLTPEYEKKLAHLNIQIIAIGRNINQLTKAVNEGKKVSVSQVLLSSLIEKLIETKSELKKVSGLML